LAFSSYGIHDLIAESRVNGGDIFLEGAGKYFLGSRLEFGGSRSTGREEKEEAQAAKQ